MTRFVLAAVGLLFTLPAAAEDIYWYPCRTELSFSTPDASTMYWYYGGTTLTVSFYSEPYCFGTYKDTLSVTAPSGGVNPDDAKTVHSYMKTLFVYNNLLATFQDMVNAQSNGAGINGYELSYHVGSISYGTEPVSLKASMTTTSWWPSAAYTYVNAGYPCSMNGAVWGGSSSTSTYSGELNVTMASKPYCGSSTRSYANLYPQTATSLSTDPGNAVYDQAGGLAGGMTVNAFRNAIALAGNTGQWVEFSYSNSAKTKLTGFSVEARPRDFAVEKDDMVYGTSPYLP